MTRLFVTLLLGCSLVVSGQHAPLSLERLYTLPWIIGTAPKEFVWSSNSKRLAFLWNNKGTNFYDVWLADTATAKPVRVTSMPRQRPSVNATSDFDKLREAASAETDSGVSAVAWCHGGEELLFTLHGALYLVKPGSSPVRLLGAMQVSNVKPSPRADAFGFVSDGDLWVATFHGEDLRTQRITALARKDVGVEEFHWSPDGQRLALIEEDQSHMPVRGIPDYLAEQTKLVPVKRPFPGEPSEYRRVAVVPANGGSVIQPTPLRWINLGPNLMDLIFTVAWSPDSKTILVDKSDLYIKHRQILLVEAVSQNVKQLLSESDPKNVTAEWWADWAPTGKGIYFTSDRDNDYHLYYQSRLGGSAERLTSGNWAVFSATISPAANAIFFTANLGKSEERHLFRLPLDGGATQRLTTMPGTHTAVVSPDGQFAADHFSSDLIPPDLYLTALREASAAVQVTHSPQPEFNDYRWVGPRYVSFSNVHDGTELHARLTLPPGFDQTTKYPAILGSVYSNTVHNQWGGRVAHPTWGLDQYLAQQGYVLLNIDISGSSGYGKAFRQRIGLDYGGVDVEDLFSGAQYLKSLGYIDPERIGIWGSSYGGLLTTMSLFTHPGTYKAGVAGAPATSLFHALTGEMRTMMAPRDHQAEYARSSAYLKSGGLQDHLLLIHGMRDQVVLFKDSVTLQQRFILQGKDGQLLALPDAPHSWDTGSTAQTRYAYGHLVDFFARYLGEGPSAARQAGTPSR